MAALVICDLGVGGFDYSWTEIFLCVFPHYPRVFGRIASLKHEIPGFGIRGLEFVKERNLCE
jgi:hypothetical protein